MSEGPCLRLSTRCYSGRYISHLKSPRYTGGDLMFLYRFVRRRRRRPGSACAAATAAGTTAGHRRLLARKLLSNFLDFLHFWRHCWPWPIDYLFVFYSIFVVTLTLNFQGQIWNLLYLSQKWFDCHKTKSKHIDFQCDHRVWPWPWPWPWIFKVKYGICCISAKSGLIAAKQKTKISIEPKPSNVTIGFDLGHDIDLEFSRSKMEFAISQ